MHFAPAMPSPPPKKNMVLPLPHHHQVDNRGGSVQEIERGLQFLFVDVSNDTKKEERVSSLLIQIHSSRYR